VKAQQKQHAAVAQPVAPLVKPSGRNWLAYAGIGTVASLAGGTAGTLYKAIHLPHSKIELKEGWIKFELEEEVDGKVHIFTPEGSLISYSVSRDPKEISTSTHFKNEEVINGKTCKGTRFDRTARANESNAIVYRLFTKDGARIEGLLVEPNLPKGKLKDKSFYVAWEDPKATYGIIMDELGTMTIEGSGDSSPIQNSSKTSIIKPPNTSEGWQEKLTNLWEKFSLEHEKITDVHSAFQKEGYTIETGKYKLPEFTMYPDALTYKNWEEVAKAAVKNEKDWGKLVPREGMLKFMTGGALAGLAVAGAGIWAWEASHPKKQKLNTLS
jgi:hypothetical protein